MIKYDFDEKGIVTKDNFADSLTGMGVLVEEEEMKKVVVVYDKNKDGNVDFNDFLIGKKYVNKNYLMSVFEGKKKKKGKKGKGGKKKGKFKFVMLICIKDEGLRIYGGVLLEMFIERYIYFTDINCFDRDKFLVYLLQDDFVWYLNYSDRMYMNIVDVVKNGDYELLKNVFQRGLTVDIRDKYYKILLMVVCVIGRIDMVKFFVDNG